MKKVNHTCFTLEHQRQHVCSEYFVFVLFM